MQGNAELFNALGKIDPKKPYGTELFNALARLTVSVAIEAVCLRWISQPLDESEIWVYLVQRASDDTAYPGQWHCPGSVMRPSEEIKEVFSRLSTREFGCDLLSQRFIADVNHPEEERGHFLSRVYLCTMKEKENNLRGKWFPAHHLPEVTVVSHRARIIPVALGAFLSD